MGRRRAWLTIAVAGAAWLASAAAQGDDVKSQCISAADQGQAARDDKKLRSARDAFKTCSQPACPKMIAKSCEKWLADVESTMPSLIISVKDDQGAPLTDVEVTLDGARQAGAAGGKPIEVDPGDHFLHFDRPGSAPDEERVSVQPGDKNHAVRVVLHGTHAGEQPTQEQPQPEPTATASHASVFTARNVVGGSMLLAGIGVGAVGAYFIGQAGSASSTASGLRGSHTTTYCTDTPSDPACQQISDAVNQQHNDNTIGIAMIAGGGALAVGAVVVWLVWPSPKTEAPTETGIRWVTPAPVRGGGATLEVGGAW